MALPLRVSLMDAVKLCLVLGVTLGITSSDAFPMHNLPPGVVHVFFMHREPVFMRRYTPVNTNDDVIHSREPPLRRLYHDLMTYLDRSIDSVETLDREYQQTLNTSADPWVHFLNRTKSFLSDNHTTDGGSNARHTLTGDNIASDATNKLTLPGSNATLELDMNHSANQTEQSPTSDKQNFTETHTNSIESNHLEAADGLASTIEKRIDEELGNKTQAVLKRKKRVADNSVAGNKTETVQPAVKKTNETATLVQGKNTINSSTRVQDTNTTNSSNQARAEVVNNTTGLSGTLKLSVKGAAVKKNSSSLLKPTSSQPEPQNRSTSSLPEVNATVVNKILDITPSNNLNKEDGEDIIKEVFENSVSEKNYSLGTTSLPVTQKMQEENVNEKDQQQLRNILDAVPMTPGDETWDNTARAGGEEQVSSGDIMTALVIPVFLVVLMGTLLYAMHNMSQYFITRTNHRQPPPNSQQNRAAPPPDGLVEVPLNNVTVTNPVEVQENKMESEETVKQSNIKPVNSSTDVNVGFVLQPTDCASKITKVTNYVTEMKSTKSANKFGQNGINM